MRLTNVAQLEVDRYYVLDNPQLAWETRQASTFPADVVEQRQPVPFKTSPINSAPWWDMWHILLDDEVIFLYARPHVCLHHKPVYPDKPEDARLRCAGCGRVWRSERALKKAAERALGE